MICDVHHPKHLYCNYTLGYFYPKIDASTVVIYFSGEILISPLRPR